MKLGDKIRYLREVEGSLRGMGRALNQQELVRLIEAETGGKLSQSYLSQIENGARPHLTNTTRQTLASFFKVHPGYLVDDPEGYHPELQSEVRGTEDKLDFWLVAGAEKFRRDAVLKHALLTLARHEQSRECLLLLEAILETPGLMPRLLEVLRPAVLPATELPESFSDEAAHKDDREKTAPRNGVGKKGLRVGR
jgi:transcriptional regulator with XRE-family HTH domain